MVIALSSLDIHYLIRELNYLEGSKIEKIFQMEDEFTFLFQLHVPSKGKHYLFVSLPSSFCLIDFKPVFPNTPPPFCSSLRRKITGARIQKIEQHNFERIINIDLSTFKGNSRLTLELFSKGNLILQDSQNKILSVAKSQSFGNRFLRPGIEYEYPPTKLNTLKLNHQEFEKLIKQSDKESLVKSLAIDFSLGGDFAEELVFRSRLDKKSPIIELSEENIKELYHNLNDLLNQKLSPIIYNEKTPLPFKLQGLDESKIKKFEKFNEAISQIELKNYQKELNIKNESSKKEELSKLDKILNKQQNQIKGLDKSQESNQEKGELIYQNYNEIKKILEFVDEENKAKSWKEIKEMLKQNPLFVSLDEH